MVRIVGAKIPTSGQSGNHFAIGLKSKFKLYLMLSHYFEDGIIKSQMLRILDYFQGL